jgi:hypothetical protein
VISAGHSTNGKAWLGAQNPASAQGAEQNQSGQFPHLHYLFYQPIIAQLTLETKKALISQKLSTSQNMLLPNNHTANQKSAGIPITKGIVMDMVLRVHG